MTNTPLENAIIQLLFETKAGRDAPLIPTSPGAENKTTAETTEFEKLYRHPSGTAIHTTAIRLRKATKAYYRDLEKLFKDGKRAENRVKAVRLVEAWLRNDVAPHLREATAAALGVTSQGVQGIAPQLTVNSAPRATPVVVVPPPPVPVIRPSPAPNPSASNLASASSSSTFGRATRAAVKPPVVEVDDSEDEDMDEDNVARRNSIKQGKKRAVSELHDENNYSIDTYYRGSMLEKQQAEQARRRSASRTSRAPSPMELKAEPTPLKTSRAKKIKPNDSPIRGAPSGIPFSSSELDSPVSNTSALQVTSKPPATSAATSTTVNNDPSDDDFKAVIVEQVIDRALMILRRDGLCTKEGLENLKKAVGPTFFSTQFAESLKEPLRSGHLF